jgi:DNA-binding transcriptional LysR family regulator
MNISDVTLAQIRIFIAVVDTASFTLASETLDLTQSAVSHSIRNLESALGVKLLNRHRSGVCATPIGHQILLKCKEIVSSTEDIAQKVSFSSNLSREKIIIGAFPSMSNCVLPNFIQHFERKFPNVEIVLIEGTDEEIKSWLYSYSVDLGTVTLPVKKLDSIRIAQDEFMCIVSNAHYLASSEVIDISRIEHEDFIMSGAGCKPSIMRIFEENDLHPKVALEISNVKMIFKLVHRNMGITIVPETLLPSNQSDISALRIEPRYFRDVGIASVSFQKAKPAAQLFVEELRTWRLLYNSSEAVPMLDLQSVA